MQISQKRPLVIAGILMVTLGLLSCSDDDGNRDNGLTEPN